MRAEDGAGHSNVASEKLNRVYVDRPAHTAGSLIGFKFGSLRLQQAMQGLAVGALQE